MIDELFVKQLVEDYIRESEYFLVDVRIEKDNSIFIDIDSNDSVSIDYCSNLSQYIESKLDRESEDFNLEVGSAGLTSPFRVLLQYKKYLGQEVEVQEQNGPKYTGVLVDVQDDKFSLEILEKVKLKDEKKKVEQKRVLTFLYDQIKYTKYLIRFK